MPEPVYSRRYPRDGKSGRAKEAVEFEALGKEKLDFLRRQQRRNLILGKVIEVTNRSHCDVDVFEGNGTMLVKIYLDFPRAISELDGMLSMAGTIAISDAKDGHDVVLSIIYDL